ncbi:MAG TPA: TlpA disulfide reductase family protein [Gammaproteobacteria bacterium]|nr:TlpA disulfide reductase family protein [Gammaproteobacteria bacterium]
MAKARPALLTVALSAAAVLGYLSYRFLLPPAPQPETPDIPASALIGADADESADAPELAATLPDFTLDSLAGGPQSIKSWPGKPLLINFWATWCGPCLREIPMLKEFQTGHTGLQVVGIAVDKRDPVVGFADRMQFNYPILIGEGEGWDAAAAFGVSVYALPFTVFTAADGSVLGVHTGELHTEHLENLTAILADLDQHKIGVDEARARLAGRM